MCDFKKEVEPAFTFLTVQEEAERCLLCHDAPCTKACPAQTDPAKFIRSVRFRNFKGAAETIRLNNGLGAICARVCPTEKYCQAACSRTGIDKPIDIGGIQRFVTDFEEHAKMHIFEKGVSNGMKVALVGSGPGNLSAGIELLQKGYDVEFFDDHKLPGGYLTYGIPEYRLPQHVIDVEIDRIKDLGAVFHQEVLVGKDVMLEELKANFDAVVLGPGFKEGKMLDFMKDNKHVVSAVDFLKEVKETDGKLALPDHVVVIGGGDVAMDVSTTCKKLGVTYVTDVIYEDSAHFVASKKELEGTRNVGVTMIDAYVPSSISDNEVVFKHRFLENELKLKADLIVLAVGQVNDRMFDLDYSGNEVAFEGYHAGENVFVTGDIAKGEKTVVFAVKKGKEAACAVDAFLQGGKR